MAPVTVPTAEYKKRIDRVRDKLAANDADALCLFSPVAIEWISGFYHQGISYDWDPFSVKGREILAIVIQKNYGDCM